MAEARRRYGSFCNSGCILAAQAVMECCTATFTARVCGQILMFRRYAGARYPVGTCMNAPVMDAAVEAKVGCSQRLMGAALAGLLCLAGAGCSSKDEPAESAPGITSSKVVGPLDVGAFTDLCDARGGTVEVMPHCGGFASAKGFSYDSTTQSLSEHTCKGANTCAGWNCAIVD